MHMTARAEDKTTPRVQAIYPTKGQRTRERLLDLAYEAMITKGIAATSVEEIVEGAGITKSGFFYHFQDKHDLARHVHLRYRAQNDELFDTLSARARQLSDDPLHSFLIFLKLYAEAIIEHVDLAPGCLVATVAFQERSVAHDVRVANVEMVAEWQTRFRDWLDLIMRAYRPNTPIDIDVLADAGWSAIFGSFTLAKTTGPAGVVGAQLLLYRETIRQVFAQSDRLTIS
jgi:TetR/AcrR family transcriptional regulator, transcriptional repressor for nem operon